MASMNLRVMLLLAIACGTTDSTLAFPSDMGATRRQVEGVSSLSQNEPQPYTCGTRSTPDDVERAQMAFMNLSVVAPELHERRQGPSPPYSFDVQWWVIASDFTYDGGWIPDEQIIAQMDMLNRDFANTGITWNHIGTRRILNRHWHESITTLPRTIPLLMQLHSTFKVPGPSVLNIYTLGFYDELRTSGASTLPVNYARNPTADGIMLLWNVLPGGTNLERQGSTLTHEAGHWLGLVHTFDGGCFGVGDGVEDTPPQRTYTVGCPVGIDTCPGGGPDHIFNWMDYSAEGCRREFTPGQVALMRRSIQAFRMPRERP